MSDSIRFVGLDVHADSITVAVAEEGRSEARHLVRLPNDLARLLKSLDRLGPRVSLRCAYEAGPTGYGLQRALAKAGIDCVVIAPSKVPRGSGDRVKTDRKDAQRLAHFLRSGDLVKIRVPDEACEAMRDLIRARSDAKTAQLRARHQLSKFLLRHDRRWAKSNWTRLHIEWIDAQKFDHIAQNKVLAEYLHAVYEHTDRIKRFDQALAELVPATEQAALIEALQAFRGIQLLTAASIAYEIGDLRRFPSAKKLMGYIGAVPSEDSSGDKVRSIRCRTPGAYGVAHLVVPASQACAAHEVAVA